MSEPKPERPQAGSFHFLPARGVLLFFACLSLVSAETLATFDGGSITEQELGTRFEIKKYEIENELYKARDQFSRRQLAEKLLAIEAKKKNKTGDALLNEYISGRLKKISDEEARSFYKQNKEQIGKPYSAIKNDITTYLYERQRKKHRRVFINRLFKKYNVKFLTKAPQFPSITIDIAGEPYWGAENARVTIVEFSDFECPYCQKMQPAIRRIRNEYKDKVRWVFKDFPLSFHQQAMQAHIAANCAGEQNKYFEYHARLFDVSPRLDKGTLVKEAQGIDLDVARFQSCLSDFDQKQKKEIEADQAYGNEVGVNGTPALFINGKPLSGFRTYGELKKEIEAALKNN